jgi:hypothetical protein
MTKKNMEVEQEEQLDNPETRDTNEKFIGRRPDFRGKEVAVWQNARDGKEWLTISVRGSNKKLVAFRNDNLGMSGP